MKPTLGAAATKLRAAVVSSGLALLMGATVAHADFVNGNFATGDFTGWTQSSYYVPTYGMSGVFPPQTETDLQLSAGSSPMSVVLGPGSASSTNNQLAWSFYAVRVHDEISGDSRRVSSIEQTITVTAADVDPNDNKVHIRFTAAPVLEDPGHEPYEQPYFFIEITGPGGSLWSTFNFANEPGVPWHTYGARTFTDWQAFDIALDPADAPIGSTLTLKAFGAGCSQSAHAGAVYMRDVRTARAVASPSLWITADGPATACAGTQVTYTYNYENNGSDVMSDVLVEAALPVTNDTTPLPAIFVGVTNPSFGGGSCAAPVSDGDPVICTIGTLQPGESGTFSMTVTIPAGSTGTSLNNGNYTISGEDPGGALVSQLGPLVRTALDRCMKSFARVPTLDRWGLLLLGLGMFALVAVTRRRRYPQ